MTQSGSAKSHRILCLQLSIHRLKETPVYALGETLCFFPFRGTMFCKCNLHQQPWTLIFVPPRRVWAPLPVLQFGKYTQAEYRSHIKCCPSFKDHSLAPSTQYLKAASSYILSSFMVNYSRRGRSNTCYSILP